MHAHKPDSIFTGVIRYMGWEKYYQPTEEPFTYPITLPETTVGELARHIKEKLGLNGLRYLGSHAERHLGYGTVFMDAEKDARTRAFAGKILSAL